MAANGDLGVYLHVPFCERVCPYCDFAVVKARVLEPEREARTVDALLRELEARAPAFGGLPLRSIYLGGGTPSLLQPGSVARLIGAVRAAFGGAPEEVTLEVNPSSLERGRLAGFRAAGVDRLSVGVQSFDDDTLRRLGRAHRAVESHRTLDAARAAGFERLSLDLILAAPGQSRAAAARDVAEAVAHAPEHLSAYALSIEPGTPFARGHARGRLAVPDDDEAAAMLEDARDRLEAAGLAWYEISSYARAGAEARHNQRYWRRAPVLGLGVGAHSTEPASAASPHGARAANERDHAAWLARIEAGQGAQPPEREVPDVATARGEAAWLALRTARGLRPAEFSAEFGAAPRAFFAEAIERSLAGSELDEDGAGVLRLTRRGWLLADEVCARFVVAIDSRGAPC